MELNMSMKQTQTLSPQMMQSMEILQMGSQELLEYIEEAVQENPVLEPEETYDKQDEFSVLRRKLEWLGSPRMRKTGSITNRTVRMTERTPSPITGTQMRRRKTSISTCSLNWSCWTWSRSSWRRGVF